MDDKRIEDMLRECWTPAEPDGMRERVLRRGREAMAREGTRRPALLGFGWKPALALLALLTILVSGVYDNAYQSRISAMAEGPDSGMMPSATCRVDMMSNRYELDRLLAQSTAGYGLFDDIGGRHTL